MDVNSIANKARKSISKYCISECKSYCCKKGFLTISSKEADLITNGKTNEFVISENIIRIDEKSLALNLGKTCPSLIDCKCAIYTNPRRPRVCHTFPIFIEQKSIKFSQGCPAVINKMFYQYEKQFLQLGYKLRVGK